MKTSPNTLKCSGRSLALAIIPLVVGIATPTLHAAVAASDDFDFYSVGALTGNDLGLGWSGGWNAPGNANTTATVVDTSLGGSLNFTPIGGAPIEGGDRAVDVMATTGTSALAGSRTLAQQLSGADFYMSVLVSMTGGTLDGSNTFSFIPSNNTTNVGGAVANTLPNTNTLQFGFRNSTAANDFNNNAVSTDTKFMVRIGTGGVLFANQATGTGSPFANNTTYFLVAQYIWGGASYDSLRMWLNPTATDDVDTPFGDTNVTVPNAGSGITSVSSIIFRQAVLQPADAFRFDELTIGQSWGDVVVVPEPGAGMLALAGSLGLTLSRRRRK